MLRDSPDSDDPLSLALVPPHGESPDQKAKRLAKEGEARRISNEIDANLKVEAAALKKRKKTLKLLLLGQSESGKSTTLKNFQFIYARKAWLQERAAWKAVVQLNLVRSINIILTVLSEELVNKERDVPLANKHQLLKLRLAPLRHTELGLRRRLGASSSEEFEFNGPSIDVPKVSYNSESSAALPTYQTNEFYVRDHKAWKSSNGSVDQNIPQDSQEVASVISSCKNDMKSLWEDEVVHLLLKNRGINPREFPGFFLDDIERIAALDYEPTDNDVIRARLRTIGVQEYYLDLDDKSKGYDIPIRDNTPPQTHSGFDLCIIDVGGSRTRRAAWIPYFEDVNAVLFLAPISCFNETLAEDDSVNRLEDSFLLWKAICSSPMLASVTLIIFLNKTDILEQKLAAGISVNRYITSYGDRPNEVNAVSKYLRDRFKEVLRKHSPASRSFYGYSTSVIDTKTTTTTIQSVRDGILRDILKTANVL